MHLALQDLLSAFIRVRPCPNLALHRTRDPEGRGAWISTRTRHSCIIGEDSNDETSYGNRLHARDTARPAGAGALACQPGVMSLTHCPLCVGLAVLSLVRAGAHLLLLGRLAV